MKNSYIALAVFSMAALLVSCETVNEVQDNTYIPGENEVVFTLAHNRIQTKASDTDVTTARVTTMELGKHGENNFFLDETVVDLNGSYSGPETKGTPAYTENLGVLYKGKLGVYADGGNFGTSEVTYEQVGDDKVGDGWQYTYKYDSTPWPSSGSVGLYFRMPNDDSSVSVTGRSGGQFTFTYTSPSSSTSQKDILFGYRTATKSEYEASVPNGGLPILLKHALAGVKFAAGNPEDVTITGISIAGLYNTGTCVIAPSAENGGYTDITGTHSSAGDIVSWTPTTTSTGTFTNSYSGTVNYGKAVTTVVGDKEVVTYKGDKFTNNGDYPDSFAATGNLNNLNDGDASQTFWFIPQDFGTAASPRDVTLTVSYTLKNSTSPLTLEINLGELFAGRGIQWNAGELYTYTIRIDEVNVKIEDTVTPGTGGAILGSTKNAVKITNTGNTDVFIRAAIVGQWLDEEDRPVFGFTDKINQLYLVESWYEDQFKNHTGEHGVFVNLAGYSNKTYGPTQASNPVKNWFYNDEDGYYYYTKTVAPGMATGQTEINGPYDALFDSYTIKKIPHAELAGEYLDAHMYFVLEIATQAISARTDDGTLRPNSDYLDAWTEARTIVADTPYTPETGEEG